MPEPEPLLLTVNDPGPGKLSIGLERLMASRLIISAASNGGKSWALRYVLEQTQALIQQFVLDPEGEFASLREQHDYLLIGPDGELPAVPSQAQMLARRLLGLGVSAILDLSELPVDARHEFVAEFCRGLLAVPRAEWRSVLVALDEIQLFAPENGRGESVALQPVIDLSNLGRKRAQCLVGASQRLANVHNNVLAAMNNKLIGLTTLDVDVRRAVQDLGFARRDQRQSLKLLDPGQFYALGPAICREPTLVHTGQVLTTHPRPGMVLPPVPPAPATIRALASQLQDLQTATAEDLDLEGAKARIAELERRLAEQQPKEDTAKLEPLLTRNSELMAELDRLQMQVAMLQQELRNARASADAKRDALKAAKELFMEARRVLAIAEGKLDPDVVAKPESPALDLERLNEGTGFTTPKARTTKAFEAAMEVPHGLERPRLSELTTPNAPPATNGTTRMDRASAEVSGLSEPQLRILRVLARLANVGAERPHRAGVAALASYRWKGGHYNNLLRSLRSRGLIDYPDSTSLALTDAGQRAMDAAGYFDTRPYSLREYHEAWLGLLSRPQQRLLRVLIDRRTAMPRAELARAAGLTPGAGHFNNVLGSLHTLGLVERVGQFEHATGLLFPDALPVAP